MKVALLISGYLRSFKINIPLIKSKILDKFDIVDTYIHITKNEIDNDKYFNITNESDDISHIKNIFNPKCIILEENIKLFENNKKNNLYNTWIKYYKLNEIKKINEKINGEYDLVIKYRPDLNIISENIFVEMIDNIIYIPNKSLVDKSKLKNIEDNHACDIFAYGKSNLMNIYFDIYNFLDILSEKYGYTPETIMYEYLKNYKIPHKFIDLEYSMILSLCNTFAICGDSGSGKSTLGNILEKYFSNSFVLECDRYHKWERGNKNWKKITHLNPKANYITKMNNDIFDLKIGKNIYQVNYDHGSGQFTQKEKINCADNIIVCGLHNLYSNENNIYNLKIFMDTDINLKNKWKIKRDMKNRSYNLKEVLKQIKARQKDYYKYIYPQREKSDIIINFYTNNRFNIKDLNKKDEILLNIYIHKNHSIINIISELSKNLINFKIDSKSENNFNIISFKEYKKTNLLNGLEINFNNYYDYIIFCILSLRQKNE